MITADDRQLLDTVNFMDDEIGKPPLGMAPNFFLLAMLCHCLSPVAALPEVLLAALLAEVQLLAGQQAAVQQAVLQAGSV